MKIYIKCDCSLTFNKGRRPLLIFAMGSPVGGHRLFRLQRARWLVEKYVGQSRMLRSYLFSGNIPAERLYDVILMLCIRSSLYFGFLAFDRCIIHLVKHSGFKKNGRQSQVGRLNFDKYSFSHISRRSNEQNIFKQFTNLIHLVVMYVWYEIKEKIVRKFLFYYSDNGASYTVRK